jgi:hypothetical protein
MSEDPQSEHARPHSLRQEKEEPWRILGLELARHLDLAERLTEAGEVGKAGSILRAILKPLLARPWAIELLYALMKSPDLDAERVDRALDARIRQRGATFGEPMDELRSGEADGIVSVTLARLHWRQGYRAEALNMYRQLVRSNPGDVDLLREYTERLQAFQGRGDERHPPLEVLELWAAKIRSRKSELPNPVADDVEES